MNYYLNKIVNYNISNFSLKNKKNALTKLFFAEINIKYLFMHPLIRIRLEKKVFF